MAGRGGAGSRTRISGAVRTGGTKRNWACVRGTFRPARRCRPGRTHEAARARSAAVDRVLLRAISECPLTTNQRVAAAALVSVVHALVEEAPVLVAIDDVQWLDPCSQAVVAFAARRFKGRVGVLVTERVDAETDSASWLQLAKLDAVDHIRVGPLSPGGLHTLISTRLGQSLPRPTMVRIAEASGGNPYYALELARAIDAASTSADSVLPATLAELMRIRIGRLDQPAQERTTGRRVGR